MNNFSRNFILCGIIGWIIECIYTGFVSLLQGDVKLSSHTSIWMFPIYGTAAFIPILYKNIKNLNIILRSFIYAMLIISVEYITGSILLLFNGCPWSYSESVFNYCGIIRLDYFPLWMIVGLIYEEILFHI